MLGCRNLPGQSFSQSVFPSENQNAGQPFQVLVRQRNPVVSLTASPRLQQSNHNSWNSMNVDEM